jgi:hypothetical protein
MTHTVAVVAVWTRSLRVLACSEQQDVRQEGHHGVAGQGNMHGRET